MADHSGHEHHHAGPAASTVAPMMIDNVLNSDLASNVSAFLSALAEQVPSTGEGGDHSGHGGHDHSAHTGHTMDHSGHDMAGHMMKMWFHGGYDEVILFDFWRTNSCMSLFLSCIVIFVMGALYEGIKWFRVYLQMTRGSIPPTDESVHKSGEMHCHGDAVPLRSTHENSEANGFGPTSTPPAARRGIRLASGKNGAFSPFRIAEALLYSLQLILAYWLMLIVMTYNTWLTIAVIAGAGFGHWLFAILNILSPNSDRHDSFTTDACH